MSTPAPVTARLDPDGVGWITFDDPASRANVFNPALLAALTAALDELAAAPVRAVVIAGAKEKIFIAGADLRWLGGLADEAAAVAASAAGHAVLARVAAFKVPVVCAIHGACAGGGYELALACDWRLASDAKETVVGLPELSVGLIPGWGGTVWLPRLIGAGPALDHCLRAQLVPAAAALAAGLVDEVAPVAEWRERARTAALRLAESGRPARPAPAPATAEVFTAARAAAARRRGETAPAVLIDLVERTHALPPAEAAAAESAAFGPLARSEGAANLIHAFFLKDAAKKTSLDGWFPPAPEGAPAPKPLRYVGIVGAGVMGSGIAQWCAARGLGVLMNDADTDALKRGIEVIRGLFQDMVKRGQLDHATAHRATGGIGITTDLRDFEDCDIVIEAVAEDVAAKRKLFAELAKIVRPDCLLASNTSALPIEELMADAAGPERALGLHFFNPVIRMPLVEFVLGRQTSRTAAAQALDLVGRLGKTPVICRSAPGFYTTRALFFYLNEACRLWEAGVPAAAIDGALREWGWPMGPLRLLDEIGLDVADFILRELAQYYPGRFEPTAVCGRLLAAGMRGRKNGTSAGFYTYAEGEAPNPALAAFAPPAAISLSPAAIQERLLGVFVAETERVIAEGVLRGPDDADLALLLGAGFPAWRGGLMHWARGARGTRR